MKGQAYSQYPVVEREIIDSLKRDLTLAESLMIPASEKSLEELIAVLSDFLPSATNRKLSEDEADLRLELFIEALADIPADLIDVARQRCMRNCKFSPSPAEIREQVKPEIDEREMAGSIIKALLLKAGITNP